jgi:tetratricopeptide (TPR) repeat protein
MSRYGMQGIPLEAQHLYRRGRELVSQKKPKEAADCLRQAIIIAPRFAGAYRELGACLSRLGRAEDAADCLRKLSFMESPGYGHPVSTSTG